jgi:hypothetical protein
VSDELVRAVLVRCVIYARVSDDGPQDVKRARQAGDDDPSIEEQLAACRAYAQANGCVVVREYIDRDKPASDYESAADRPDFARMQRDAKEKGDFDAVIVRMLDRFSRLEPFDFAEAANPLRRLGVNLVTVDGGPKSWDGAVNQVMMAVEQLGKADYVKTMALHVCRGLRQTVETFGGHVGGAILGYDVVRVPEPRAKRGTIARLVPNDQAPLAKEMFRRYAAGEASLRSLANWLNTLGVKSPRGLPWSSCSVRLLLKNRKYLGESTWGAKSRAKHALPAKGGARRLTDEDKRARRKRFDERPRKRVAHAKSVLLDGDPDDKVVREHAHEPLVDVATFEAVQQRLAARRNRTDAQRQGDYLFNSLVRCASCGYCLQGKRSHKRQGEWVRKYVCGGSKLRGPSVCRHREVYEDWLLSQLGDMLFNEVLADGAAAWEAQLRATLEDRARNAPDDVKRLKADADAAAKAAENAKKNLAETPHDLYQSVLEGLRKLEARHAGLKARLVDVQRHAKKVQDVDKALAEAKRRLCQIGGMMNGHRAWDRELLRQNVEYVEISWHEQEVTTPRRGTYVRSRPASITLVFKEGSVLSDAEGLAVFFGADVEGDVSTARRS